MTEIHLPPEARPDPPEAGFGGLIRSLLRDPKSLAEALQADDDRGLTLRLALLALGGHTVYGLIVGSFSGGDQWVAAPLKITGTVFLASAICLPSLFVFACIGQSRATVIQVVRLLVAQTALNGLLLAAFGPVALVFSLSTYSVISMGMIHLLLGIACVAFGVRLLIGCLRGLNLVQPGFLRLWAFVFVLTGLQLLTAVRPILGTAETIFPNEKRFFLGHWGHTVGKAID